jgi:O-antigen ligase
MISLAPYTASAALDERRNSSLAVGAGALLSLFMLLGLRWPYLWLGVAAVIGVVGLLWAARYTVKHPIWLACAMLLIEVGASLNFFDESVRPFLRYPLLFLFCLPVLPTLWRDPMALRGGFRLYLIYFALALFSVTYSIAPFYSLGRVVGSVLLFGGVYTVSQNIKDEQDMRRLFGVLWVACCVILAGVAASWVLLPSDLAWQLPNQWSDDSVVRFVGFLNSSNQVGEVALPTIATGMLFWKAATRRVRIAIAASIALAILFAVMADSRSSLAAVVIGLVALTFDRYRWRAAVAWLLLLALAVGGASLLSPDRLEYLNRGDMMTLTGRTDIWRFTLSKIKESPILGYGYEVEGQIFQDRHFPLRDKMWDQGPYIALHSGYLTRAAGLGVPSLLLWLFFILRPMVGIFRGVPDYFRIRDAILIGALPVLLLNIDESAASDCRYTVGLLLTFVWCIAERSRLLAEDSRRLRGLAEGGLLAANAKGG